MVPRAERSENQKCFAIRAPNPSGKARPKNIHPPCSSLSTTRAPPHLSPLGSGGRVLAPPCWIRRQLARRRPGRAAKGGLRYIVLERRRRGWEGVQCGVAGGSTRERERRAGNTRPFHPWAGRWMVFGGRGPSAPALATGRRQSARGRGGGAPPPRPRSTPPYPARPGLHIKPGAAAAGAEAGGGGGGASASSGSWACLRGENALSAQPSRGAPGASRRYHARPRGLARPAGPGPLPGAPGIGRPGDGWQSRRAGQDVHARQPLGGR